MTRRNFPDKVKAEAFERAATCATCGAAFSQNYRVSAKRAAKPKYCSRECFSSSAAKRAVDIRQRLSAKIRTGASDECWPWTGRTDPRGYGRIDHGGRPQVAHRMVFFSLYPDANRALVVCHSCDNPPCCNPKHLWLGTQLENVADMHSKGRAIAPRTRIGPECNTTKLTEDQVHQIMASDLSNPALGRQYGVTSSAIYNIRRGRSWAHVTGIKRDAR